MIEKTKRILRTAREGLLTLWMCRISVDSPKWIGWIWQNISGNGKGYGYDLGAEKGISVLVGCVVLFVYLILLVAPALALACDLYKRNKWHAFIPLLIFVVGFIVGGFLLG